MCKTSSSWQWRKHLSLEVTFPFWLYSHWASLIAQLVKNPWAFLLSPVYLIFFILRISMDSFSWFPDISNEFQTVANILCSGLVKITYYHLYLLKLTKNIHCFFTCRLFFFFYQIIVKHVMISSILGEWNCLRKVGIRASCRVIRQKRLSSWPIRWRVNLLQTKGIQFKGMYIISL